LPETVLLEWKHPVTFNCCRILWPNSTCYGMDYGLEYWTGSEWKLAYRQTANTIPLSLNLFPSVTARKARLTIGHFHAESWYVALSQLELYQVEQDK